VNYKAMRVRIGDRVKDRNEDKATVTNIYVAYPDGVKTLFLEAVFDDCNSNSALKTDNCAKILRRIRR
jgi:hypothetical protein